MVAVRRLGTGIVLTLSLALAGCANPRAPYWRADDYYLDRMEVDSTDVPQIERGRPNRFLDGLNHYVFSLPTKLLLWNGRVLDHELPLESAELLAHYIEVNRLRAVKVRHNQYAPLAEWRRLLSNTNVGAGYRYSLGLLAWLQYTLFPGRVLAGLPLIGAGDHFNPFTNTIHVYSSDPTVLLHEAGHAKDYAGYRRRGTGFILPRMIPGIDLIQEAKASSDTLHFLQCAGESDTEIRGIKSLYPAYSTYVAGYIPGGPVIALPVVIGGHIVGRIHATMRASEIQDEVFLRERSGSITTDLSAVPTCQLPDDRAH